MPKTTEELLARHADQNARRWEQAAVEMGRQRNVANARRAAKCASRPPR